MRPGYPLLPHVGNRFRARARPGVGQPVHVLQRAEDAVVGDVLAVGSRADVRPVEDGRDLVAVTAAEQRDFETGAVLVQVTISRLLWPLAQLAYAEIGHEDSAAELWRI